MSKLSDKPGAFLHVIISGSIIICAVIGLLTSVLFTGLRFGLIAADNPLIGRFCLPGEKSCTSILNAPDGHLFGLPNAVIGMLYFGWVLGITLFNHGNRTLKIMTLGVSLATLFVSAYLLYSLKFRLKARCPLCILSHACTIALFVLLTIDVTSGTA